MADFKELLKVLRRERPGRPVLFELYMNERLYRAACGTRYDTSGTPLGVMRNMVRSFQVYGYDYATVRASEYWFHTDNEQHHNQSKSVSLNEACMIGDRISFDAYPWMDPDACDYQNLARIEPDLDTGRKLVVMGPGGVLENVIALMGYDNLCMAVFDDPQLVEDVFERVGSGLVRYYDRAAGFRSVGALVSNDDWGFNTQTMLSPADMRRFVFPWHRRIVEAIHRHGKPAILHSCGNYRMIFDDLLAMGYDARHSYEDNIVPVEAAYGEFQGKMAVLGGIDVNFLIQAEPDAIARRCAAMLSLAAEGGYALGSGNSIPDYIPDEKYFAMIDPYRVR